MKVKYIGAYPIKYITANGAIELVNPGDIVDIAETALPELSKKLWSVDNKKIKTSDNKILKTEGDK